jgi:predicted extracellular nuclease
MIQGSGSTSPLVGQFVTTTGIVTALRSSGFYVQTRDGLDDHEPTTSEGLFVFTSGATVKPAVGDDVRVTGVVSEFAPAPPSPPLTELGGGPLFTVVEAMQPLPLPITLHPSDTSPAGPLEQLEKYEGMRVQADLNVIAPTDGTVFEPDATASSNGVFYAVVDGVPRPVREPGLDPASPTPTGLPCCVPHFDGNPERLRIDSGAQPGSAILNVATGQRIFGVTGVLDFAFGSYTILPDPGAGVVTGPQAATPVPVASATEFTVASANLERFFDEQDDPDHDDAVLTPDAVNLRLQKASLTVRHVLRSPDILGVVEVENLSILQRLAAKINADAVAEGDSDPIYVAYLEEGNDIGGIDSGFLVKSSRVDVISVEQIGKDTTYTPPGQAPGAPLPLLNDRPPLVLKAAVNGPVATPFPVTVIVNHLRSLSGIDGTDGERIRAKRRAQAEFLASLIQSHQATERVISIGDYNAFPFNDGFVDVVGTIKGTPTPVDQVALASADLLDPDLTNLGDGLGPTQQYSFVFDGNAQALDHILVNSLALKRFTRAGYARSNADFPESLRGDATRPERLSDHDAAIAYFSFPGAPIVTLVGEQQLDLEAYTSFTDPGASAQTDEGPLLVTTSGTVDVNTPGDYTLTYGATNGYLTTMITRIVHVQDTIPPSISNYHLTPGVLSRPNHRLVNVVATYTATDASGAPTCALTVTSSEPANGPSGGHTAVDSFVIDAQHVRLRAERSNRGQGRTYSVTVSCADGAGNISSDTARVFVPK